MAGKEDLAAADEDLAERAGRVLEALMAAVEDGADLVLKNKPPRTDPKAWDAFTRSIAGLVRTLNLILTASAKLDRIRERRDRPGARGPKAKHGNEDGMVDHRRDEWDDADTATLEAELRSRIDHNNRLHEIKQRDAGGLRRLAEEHDPADAQGAQASA